MRPSKEGLIPATGFLDAGMAPRPSFHDGSEPTLLEVTTETGGTLSGPLSNCSWLISCSLCHFEVTSHTRKPIQAACEIHGVGIRPFARQ
jgi:hypothetical protein